MTLSEPLLTAGDASEHEGKSGFRAADVFAGLQVALLVFFRDVSFTCVYFHQPSVAPYLAVGLHALVVSSVVSALVYGFDGKACQAVGCPSSCVVPFLALLSASVLKDADAPAEGGVALVLVIFAVVSLFVGLWFIALRELALWLLMWFKAGFPQPVLYGFLAGMGLSMMLSSLQLATDTSDNWGLLLALQSPTTRLQGAAAMLVGLALRVGTKVWTSSATLIVMLSGFMLFFYTLVAVLGFDFEQLQDAGYLFPPPVDLPMYDVWTQELGALPPLPTVVRMLQSQLHTIIGCLVVCTVDMLTTILPLEAQMNRHIDMSAELKVAGKASIAAGLFLGHPSYCTLSATRLRLDAGANGRNSAAVAAVCLAASLFCVHLVVAIVPKALVAGLLMYLALGYLHEGLVYTRGILASEEYVVIVVMVLLWLPLDFEMTSLVGMALHAFHFIIRYSSSMVIKYLGTARELGLLSRKPRSQEELLALDDLRERIVVAKTGCSQLFFGSAAVVLEKIAEKRKLLEAPSVVLIDVSGVIAVDASAMVAFGKVPRHLVIGGLHPQLYEDLSAHPALKTVHLFRDLDMALEYAEEMLTGFASLHKPTPRADIVNVSNNAKLREAVRGTCAPRATEALVENVRRGSSEEEVIAALSCLLSTGTAATLVAFMEAVDVKLGQVCFYRGELSKGMYVVLSGKFSLERGAGRRLRAGQFEQSPDPTVARRMAVLDDHAPPSLGDEQATTSRVRQVQSGDILCPEALFAFSQEEVLNVETLIAESHGVCLLLSRQSLLRFQLKHPAEAVELLRAVGRRCHWAQGGGAADQLKRASSLPMLEAV
eukprot:TRINITY_DN42211_c0_g1_i1.p1 TRINITY_DN42211_c0_g1~~TRINITY_DN42211_c0_g1_i1.p1  ORF type:complete len:826 (+),score=181.68 TRINITY_DN42211_c0_g1_i1:91-2568(+)